MGRLLWLDAIFLSAGITFILFLCAKLLTALLFGA